MLQTWTLFWTWFRNQYAMIYFEIGTKKVACPYLCGHESVRGLLPPGPVEGHHVDQRKVAAHVTVHDEEGLGRSRQDLVPEVVHAARRAQRSVLLEVPVSEQGTGRGGLECSDYVYTCETIRNIYSIIYCKRKSLRIHVQNIS